MTAHEIEEELKERKRLSEFNLILDNKSIKYCYIRKGSYYRPNSCGYTDFVHRAGVYTKEEAVRHAVGCRDIWLKRIDIEEHNKIIQSEIKDLKTRLLK